MYDVKENLQHAIEEIDFLINKCEKLLPNDVSKGSLCQYIKGGGVYYDLVQYVDGNRVKKYLGTPNHPEVILRKQSRYLQKRIKLLKHDRKVLKRAYDSLLDYSPETVQQMLPSAYKDWPTQCYADKDATALKPEIRNHYRKNTFPYPPNPSTACDGTPVRSKGECIWYDNLMFSGINFRYDEVVNMVDTYGNIVGISPDFTIITKDGRRIYVEHLGKLNNSDYFKRNAKKLQIYYLNGYTIGDNLIITSDNNEGQTNSQAITQAIEMIKKKL